MRRVHAITVILALFASPVALLARAMDCGQSCCGMMCCMPRHSVPSAKSAGNTAAIAPNSGAAQDRPIHCALNCGMGHDKHTQDYGLNVLMHPGFPLEEVYVAAPSAARAAILFSDPLVSFAVVPPPYQPPRS